MFFANFLEILMVSDKTVHKSFRIHKTLNKQNPLEKKKNHYLPILYFGFDSKILKKSNL